MSKSKKKEKQPKKKRVSSDLPLSKIRKIEIKGPKYYLNHAREYPIMGCWVYAEWADSGIAPVVIARKQAEDKVIAGVYMLDLYCLGIKDCFTRAGISLKQFHRDLPLMCAEAPQECTVEFAHEMVYGALEYARSYGFEPNSDFVDLKADLILDPPDTHPRSGDIKFGKDGKPFFVSGPYDDDARIRFITETLERTAGSGNYDVLIQLDGFDDEDDEFDDDFDDIFDFDDEDEDDFDDEFDVLDVESQDIEDGDEPSAPNSAQ